MPYVVQVSYLAYVSTESYVLFDIVISLFLFTFFNVYNKIKILIVACSSGSYGENCNKRCEINCRSCNGVNGLCDSGCKPGWKGIACEESRICKLYRFSLFYFILLLSKIFKILIFTYSISLNYIKYINSSKGATFLMR